MSARTPEQNTAALVRLVRELAALPITPRDVVAMSPELAELVDAARALVGERDELGVEDDDGEALGLPELVFDPGPPFALTAPIEWTPARWIPACQAAPS